jgi:hypothetical protein
MESAILVLLLASAVPAAAHSWTPSLRSTELGVVQPHHDEQASLLRVVAETPPHLLRISHLSVLYFAAFLAIVVARTGLLCADKCGGRGERRGELPLRDAPKWQEQGVRTLDFRLEAACDVLFYVPALCILFLAARVWALRGSDGELVPWITHSMTVISYAILVEYILKVVEPDDRRTWTAWVCNVFGGLAGFCMHAGAAVIVVSILTSPFKPSLAMQCITLLTAIYFAVHALLAVHRGFLWAMGAHETLYTDRTSKAFAQVQHLKETLALFPMLCIILVCVRMRALELGLGAPLKQTQDGMLALSFGAGFQVFAVVSQIMLGSMEQYCGKILGTVLSTVETLCLVTVYGGTAMVFAELLQWDPSGKVSLVEATFDAVGPIPVSMKCVTTLATLYFLAYLSVLLARCFQYVSAVIINREEYTKGRVEEVMDHTCKAVVFAPMLCMLMITLRLRSQNLGLADPPRYAQLAMVTSVGALVMQVLIAPVSSFLTGAVFGEESASSATESAKYCAVGFMVAHYLTVAVFYAALSTLLGALFAPGV